MQGADSAKSKRFLDVPILEETPRQGTQETAAILHKGKGKENNPPDARSALWNQARQNNLEEEPSLRRIYGDRPGQNVREKVSAAPLGMRKHSRGPQNYQDWEDVCREHRLRSHRTSRLRRD